MRSETRHGRLWARRADSGTLEYRRAGSRATWRIVDALRAGTDGEPSGVREDAGRDADRADRHLRGSTHPCDAGGFRLIRAT